MDGMQSVFDLAEQHMKALEDAKKNGDYQTEQTSIQHLRMILESVEQTGYDEKYVEQVEHIRCAVHTALPPLQ
ncbi:hypothetical protein [Halothiobacillus sp.]|jgi:fatty acid-binding protein DegV|uniref:hypothetical protein n=1 Tax=Halothiobacillus sp. TaxID=1891311 RepID=UPI002AD4449D|nr:hypothetical protein [Halothiobacillus sp.]